MAFIIFLKIPFNDILVFFLCQLYDKIIFGPPVLQFPHSLINPSYSQYL